MHQVVDTLVIGAGQAGLAAGYQLQRAGRSFTILEAAAQPGGSWPHYYESLRLFSPARFSSLPGLPFPGDPERYPARDEVIAYLRQYAEHFQLPIVMGARVAQVARDSEVFTVQTDDGRTFQARSLIAATGAFHRPYLPQLPGQDAFRGAVLHALAYRDPAAFQGQRVIVVGAGNSAVQIASELAQVARVTLASRAPVRFVNQRPYGRDIHFWWWLTRFDTRPLDSAIGMWLNRLAEGQGPRVLDTGIYRAALAVGKPDRRAMFTGFTDSGIAWDDGSAEDVDTVIFATGYRPNLAYLAPLGALDAENQALQRHGVSLTVPGLYFVGISDQRTFASATLRGVGSDAAVVVRHLRRHLAPAKHVFIPTRLRLAATQICCPTR
jgi:putative flavoprotein involved in K+ transport